MLEALAGGGRCDLVVMMTKMIKMMKGSHDEDDKDEDDDDVDDDGGSSRGRQVNLLLNNFVKNLLREL